MLSRFVCFEFLHFVLYRDFELLIPPCVRAQVQWHPSEPLVFSAGMDQDIKLWDSRSGSLVRKFIGHRNFVLAFRLMTNPDGGLCVVSGGDDKVVKVFSVDHIAKIDGDAATVSVDGGGGYSGKGTADSRTIGEIDVPNMKSLNNDSR